MNRLLLNTKLIKMYGSSLIKLVKVNVVGFLKIAIVSEDGLPDVRVEKEILTLSKHFDEIHFIGDFKGFALWDIDNKLKIHPVKWGRLENLLVQPYYTWLIKRVRRVLNEVKADVYLAVNLVAGNVLEELKLDFALDYHEVWSLMLKYIQPPTLARKLTYIRRRIIYPKLEEKLLSKRPYITVSRKSAQYFLDKYGNSDYAIIENYPSINEVRDVKLSSNRKTGELRTFCYIGKDLFLYDGHLSRDLRETVSTLDELWKNGYRFKVFVFGTNVKDREYVEALGWRRLINIYGEAVSMDFGIMSYKPASIHEFFSMNRFYTYVHTGLIPVITDTFKQYVASLHGFLLTVSSENYTEDLWVKYREALNMDDEEIYRRKTGLITYARGSYIWEKQEGELVGFIKKKA